MYNIGFHTNAIEVVKNLHQADKLSKYAEYAALQVSGKKLK